MGDSQHCCPCLIMWHIIHPYILQCNILNILYYTHRVMPYLALPNKHNIKQCSAEAVACFFVSSQLCVSLPAVLYCAQTAWQRYCAIYLQKSAIEQPTASLKTNTDVLLIAYMQSRLAHSLVEEKASCQSQTHFLKQHYFTVWKSFFNSPTFKPLLLIPCAQCREGARLTFLVSECLNFTSHSIDHQCFFAGK